MSHLCFKALLFDLTDLVGLVVGVGGGRGVGGGNDSATSEEVSSAIWMGCGTFGAKEMVGPEKLAFPIEAD